MPNIFHQSVEDVLKTASPEQRLMWNFLFLRFGERIAISQFVFSGVVVGSELQTYVARKLYFAYQIRIGGYGASAAACNVSLYDELNVLKDIIITANYYWDATAAAMRQGQTSAQFNNLWFSRTAVAGSGYLDFIGYRIIY